MGKFDKLIKENLRHLIRPFAERVGINLKNGRIVIIKDKLQHTIEREPDFLFKVEYDNPANNHIVQFDFQAQNDMSMPERMLFYRCFIKFTYETRVRQIVFYLGNEPLTMENYITEPNLNYTYELYDIRMFTSASFLESDVPQEILLAILGDFEGNTPDTIMEKILNRLNTLVKRKKEFQKLAFQLHVLSGLRKLQSIFKQKINKMPLHFEIDIENDPFYLEGEEKGIEIGIEKGIEIGMVGKDYENVKHLLLNTRYSDDEIAFILNVKLSFIDEVRTKISNQNSQT